MENQLKTIEEIIAQFEPDTAQRKRLDYEWDIICKTGNEERFRAWITEINRAREWDFPVTGVAGGRYCLCDYFYIGGTPNCSYLLYCAGVTKVDALKLNLPFERFINPMRNDIPELPVFFTDKNPKTNDAKLPDTDKELLRLLVLHGDLREGYLFPVDIIQSRLAEQPVKEILSETNGHIVWQEQFLHLLHVIGGYSYAEADIIRRKLAKKEFEDRPLLEYNFIKGAVELGYEQADAKGLLDELLSTMGSCPLKAHKAAVLLNTSCEDDMDLSEDNGVCAQGVPEDYLKALRAVIQNGDTSMSLISLVQITLRCGYFYAGKIVEWMQEKGYIYTERTTKHHVLLTKEGYEKEYGKME